MKRRGLTLVEALVVMGVVGVLLALTMPAIQRVRGLADRTACLSNMRQMMTAMHHYHQDYGALPPTERSALGSREITPEGWMSWQAQLLPYIEQEMLYRQALEDFRRYPGHTNLALHRGQTTVIKLYGCPSDGRVRAVHEDPYGDLGAFTSYIGADSVKDTRRDKFHSGALGLSFAEITDGLGNTIAFGERPPPETMIAGWWYHGGIYWGFKVRGPNQFLFMDGAIMAENAHPDCLPTTHTFGPGRLNNPCDRLHFWSLHGGGANFAFVDGSVRFISYHVGSDLIAALISPSGGEQESLPD